MTRTRLINLTVPLFALIIGATAGAATTYFLISKNTKEVMKVLATGQAIETVKHARLLREGDVKSVLADREKSLELLVNWYRAFEYKEPGDIRMLYSVKEYRDKWNLQMPDDISRYLDELPPKPMSSCEIAKKTINK